MDNKENLINRFLSKLKILFSKLLLKIKGFFIGLFTLIFIKPYELFRSLFLGIKNLIKNIINAYKTERKAFFKGLSSFFIPGLGQIRNKQYYKAIPLFIILAIFIIVELTTGNYIYALTGEIAQYPAEDKLYFFRDYGGFFTKGIWGFFSLGELVRGDMYRGEVIRTFDRVLTWRTADNSRNLLGQGVIALVFLTILGAVWIASIVDAYKSHIKQVKTGMVEPVKQFIRRIWDELFAYIIILPAVILIMFFTLIPFLFSFLVAFTNWTGRIDLGDELIFWTGFETFTLIISDAAWFTFFLDVLLWTVFYAFMSSVTVYVLGLIQALIIESKYVVFKKLWRLILILPWAIPGMISLMLFRNVFADNFGLINQLLANADLTNTVKEVLRTIGLLGQGVAGEDGNILWLTSPNNGRLAKAIVIVVNLWMGYPYFMLLITGVLGTIPLALYEAADIDGATGFQKFRFITFPWVLRATAPVIITTFTFNFNNFGAIYFLTSGGPRYESIPNSLRILGAAPGQTDILISWIFKLSFDATVRQFNLAAVYSILIFIFIGLTAIYNLSKLKSFWEED